MVTSASLGAWTSRSRAWTLAAFVLAVVGLGCSVLVILGSDGDPSQVVWPLVVAPLVITLVPLLVPRHGARLGALVSLGLWCVLTAFSIGMLLLPALFAALMAMVREP